MGAKSKVNIQKRYINHYYAVLAALFYALNVPVAKILLKDINQHFGCYYQTRRFSGRKEWRNK